MTWLLDALIVEILQFSPELFVLLGSHEIRRGKPAKRITVRHGHSTLTVRL